MFVLYRMAQCISAHHSHALLQNLSLYAVGTGVDFVPAKISMAKARTEAEMVLFESVSEALRESNMHPRQVRYRSHLGCSIVVASILSAERCALSTIKLATVLLECNALLTFLQN